MKLSDKSIRKGVILAFLIITWLISVLLIQAPQLGLADPVYPRPKPDYTLYIMIISAISLVIYSFKNAIDLLHSSNPSANI